MNFEKRYNKLIFAAFILISILVLSACGSTSTTALDDKRDNEATIVRTGQFENGDNSPSHTGSGTLNILQNGDALTVRFENFKSSNGPDLRVILVEKIEGTGRSSIGEKLELGLLKSTNGNQNYEVPAGTDLSKYTGVMIYCKLAGVVFSRAAFTSN